MSGALLAAWIPATAIPQLSSLSDPLSSTVVGPGGDRPQVSFRFLSNGDIEEATGDTGSALTYSKVGEWLDKVPPGDSSDWEVRVTIDSEDTGDPGTWTGNGPGAGYVALGSTVTSTYTKDANDAGTSASVLTIDLRQVSNNSNIATRSSMDYSVEISP